MKELENLISHRIPDFGYAADVGANDGAFLSNSLWLEEKGWIVLCIEANPLLAERGRSIRKLWRSVGVSDIDCDAHAFTMHGTDSWASYSSLGETARYDEMAQGAKIHVPVRRLDRLLEEAGFPRLDLLTIDVEGWEQEVIAGAALERWKPKVLIYEDYYGRYAPPTHYHVIGTVGVDRVCEREAG